MINIFENLKQVILDGPEWITWLARIIYHTLLLPLTSTSRIFWLYLLAALLVAIVPYLIYNLSSVDGRSGRGFFRYVFPRKVYAHPSSKLDYQLFFVNPLLSSVLSFLLGILSTACIATFVMQQGASLLPNWAGLGSSVLVTTLFTVFYAMASDFGTWVSHWAHHKYALLWPIHSVHHSAEVLNPLTLYRKHPLYDVVRGLIVAPIRGTLHGLLFLLFLGVTDFYTFLSMNAVITAFNLAGSNLRHSHIWISYGSVLNHIFLCPAHHQIHHSARVEHRNCNFGGTFALWDWMFGTLVLPTKDLRKDMVFGINTDEPQRHPNLAAAYWEPLQQMAGVLRRVSQSIWPGTSGKRSIN